MPYMQRVRNAFYTYLERAAEPPSRRGASRACSVVLKNEPLPDGRKLPVTITVRPETLAQCGPCTFRDLKCAYMSSYNIVKTTLLRKMQIQTIIASVRQV